MSKHFIIVISLLFIACGNNSKHNQINQQEKDKKEEKVTLQEEEVAVNEHVEKIINNQYFTDIPFHKELLSKLEEKKDTIYICSRLLLEQFNTVEQQDSIITLEYNQYQVRILSKVFEPSKHNLNLVDTIRKTDGKVDYLETKNIIDGSKAYGIDGDVPNTEIAQFMIKINQEVIQLNDKHISDIYNVNLAKTEAYFNPQNNLLYVYISGSDAAGSYAIKYVIGDNGYITRIIAEYCGFDFIDGLNYDCF